MKIILCTGLPGSGKTIVAVKLSHDAFRKDGRKIASNVPLNFAHEFIEPPGENEIDEFFDKYYDRLWLLDEIHAWFNSRSSMKKANIDFQIWITQIRKRESDIIGTTQRFGAVDISFRELCAYVIKCEAHTKCPRGHRKPAHPNRKPECPDCTFWVKLGIRQQPENGWESMPFENIPVTYKWMRQEPYWKLYDTFKIIRKLKPEVTRGKVSWPSN